MKKNLFKYSCLLVGVVIIILWIINNWKIADNIDINSNSFIFQQNGDFNSEVKATLTGSYNSKRKQFEGKLSINGLTFPNVLFTSGLALTSHDGKETDVLGIIYFDNKTERYAIELTDEKIYEKLTGKKYNNSPLIISSPASSIEEANNIHDDLEMNDMKRRYTNLQIP
ncbi:hypothetical protein P4H66_08910 [Paenibacillus dokdonensis]|uniref:Uncharacterized protein n=1 Tax=Paenibacillus dokdonensis TaxID=2567944 RepID=A0ABU6GJP8_9BACL|nr:hypothetical protein [Paenibacillus dokdonensis]MEC0239964.1 hypothetical protein [Paenibacillus dokdonensis]